MSKPDATGTKSLEEILASIRKSLTGEGSEASSGQRQAAPAPVQAAPALEPPKDTAGNGDGDGLLSARLAGALNGPTNGAALDDDFAALLAPDDKKPAQPTPASADKPADARSASKDPLWFLRRPAATAESNGAQAPMARTQPGEGAPPPTLAADVAPTLAPDLVPDTAPDVTPGMTPGMTADPAPAASPVKEVKLSRPEVLRASLPPLFGADSEALPAARTPHPEPPKARPSVAPAPSQALAAPAAPGGEVRKAAPGNAHFMARTQPILPPLQPAGDAAPIAARKMTEADVAPPAPATREAAPAVEAAPKPQTPVETKPVANGLLVETHADAAAKAAPTELRVPSATRPAPTPEAPQARTLEQVIGELLEPVIRQWLEANLPRMVEEAVREEVARAIAAEPRAPKV